MVRQEKREDTCATRLHFALGIITSFHSPLPKQALKPPTPQRSRLIAKHSMNAPARQTAPPPSNH
ncbi:hypothetical protein D7X74_28685 [Corallococcus sp. CA047B]|nr:hypothetical protein D7X74_28685 [Corallococcus sp. CA047B]